MPSSVTYYIEHSRLLYAQGRTDEATVLLRKAVEEHAAAGYLFAFLGSALWKQGLREEAITALHASARLDSDLECPRLILSHGLQEVQRPEEAISVLRDGFLISSRSRVLWLRELARVYETMGDLAQAISHFDQALLLAPDDVVARSGRERLWKRGRHNHRCSRRLRHGSSHGRRSRRA